MKRRFKFVLSRLFYLLFHRNFDIISFVIEDAGRSQAFYTLEESPSTAGQGAGEMPAEATLGKVQQRYTAKPRLHDAAARMER